MYGAQSPFGARSPLSGNVVIDPITGRDGQVFRIALEDRLNPEHLVADAPRYRLRVTLIKTLVPAVIKGDGTVQRYDIQFTSHFELRDTQYKQKMLLSDSMSRTGSYNVATNANFATYEAGQDVEERTLKELAEDYTLRLAGYFASMPKPDSNANAVATTPAAP